MAGSPVGVAEQKGAGGIPDRPVGPVKIPAGSIRLGNL
jgi:hypothetical protein